MADVDTRPSLVLLGLSAKQQARAKQHNPHLTHFTFAVLAGHYGQKFGTARECKQLYATWKTQHRALFESVFNSNSFPVSDYRDTPNLGQVLASAGSGRPLPEPSQAPTESTLPAQPIHTVRGGKICRDCGTAVSTSAKACPTCGAKKPHKGSFEWGWRKVTNFLILAGLLLWLFPNLLAYCASIL